MSQRTALTFPGTAGLVRLGEDPLVAETPETLLDDATTPVERLYIRNNGNIPPEPADPDGWTLVIDGEVETALVFTLAELKARFAPVTHRMVLECGGNGRAFFRPPAEGNQWTHGGVGCPEWTGVPLAELLKLARPKPGAVYTAHYGTDRDVDNPAEPALSRGVRLEKALEPHTMIVWGINGAPLPHIHGGPLRLIVPGWVGSASQKWLTRIRIRDREHDGPGMTGHSYRIPIRPVAPGAKVDPSNLRIIESMPVRSIITRPADGTRLPSGTRDVSLRGAAWAGDLAVGSVDLSADGGATWHGATLAAARNRYDWRRWTGTLPLPHDGAFEIRARATDERGTAQPFENQNWNAEGYAGNAMHHMTVIVG